MVEYKCNKCNKIFKQKIHYTNHLNRKFPCKIETPKNTKKTPFCGKSKRRL